VDVQITCGRKGDSGAPVDKDRYFLMRHRPDITIAGKDARSRYPGLDALQGLPSIRGVLLLDDWNALTTGTGFKAYRPPGQPVAPNGRPWCVSDDGANATRWMGKEWKDITCPARECPHFMADKGCRIGTNIMFALREPGFPSLLCRWSTQSIYTFDAVVAFRRTVAEYIAAMRLPLSFFGVPIRLGIRQKVTPKGRFPVQDITLDGALGDALLAGNRLRAELADVIARLPAALLEAGAYPEVDADDLGAGMRVLPAPATRTTSCPECKADLEPVQGKTGLGWRCRPCALFITPDGTVTRK
jgi:hypothetical protein